MAEDFREVKFDRVTYQNEFNKKNYDRITVMAPKGMKSELKRLADSNGVSVNKLIMSAINQYITNIRGDDV